MKKINVKLLVVLLAVAVISGGIFIGLYVIQKTRGSQKLLARADAMKADGNLHDAIKFRRQYLRLQPDDNEQLAQLGLDMKERIEVNQKLRKMIAPRDFQVTHAVLEESLRKSPENVDVRQAAAEFFLKFGRFKDAIEHLKYLIEQGKSSNPQNLVDLSICYLRAGQDDKAVVQLAQLVGYDPVSDELDIEQADMPDSIDSYALLAQVYGERRRQSGTAKRIINQMVTANPDSYDAYLKRAAYYADLEGKDSPVRVADIEKAREIAPDEPDVLFASAQFAIENSEYEEAKKYLEQTKEKFPEDLKVYRGLATLATQQNDIEGALTHIADGLKIDAGNIDLLWMRANIQMQAKDYESVERSIDELRNLKVSKTFIEFLEGLWSLSQGQWIEAMNKLQKVRPEVARAQSNLVIALDKGLARCHAQLGQHDLTAKDFSRVLELDPDDNGAALGEIDALLKTGRKELALKKFDTLDRKLGAPEDHPELLITRLRLEIERQKQKDEPDRLWSYAKKLGKAIVDASELDQSRKESAVALLMRSMGKEKIAGEIEKRIRDRDPDNIAWDLQRVQELSKEDPEAALQLLDEIKVKHGDMPAIRLLRAEVLVKQAPADREEQLAALTADISQFSEQQKIYLLRYMGGVHLRRGEIIMAHEMWTQAAAQLPNDIRILLGLFQVSQQLGDEDKMNDAMDMLEDRVSANGAELKWARAAYVAWRVNNELDGPETLKAARGLLDEAESQRPEWDAIYQLKAQFNLLEGDRPAAISALERALEVGDQAPGIQRELIRLYYDAGRFSRAESMLDNLDESQWTTLEQRIALDIQSQRGQLPEDIELDLASTDVGDLRWKGKLFANAKRYGDAEACLKRCLELSPASVQDWNALVRVFAVQNKREEALEAIREAQLVVPEEIAPVFLGQAYETIRELSEAERQYKTALDVDPNNLVALQAISRLYVSVGQVDAARPYLDRMVQSVEEGAELVHPTVPWARRVLANVIASSNTYQDFTNALKLVEANQMEGRPMASDDLLLWAQLSAKRPDSFSRMRALELIEETAEERRLSDNEKLVLADLYNKQNRWPECQSVMNDLLATNTKNMQLLQPWLRWLLEHEQLTQAERWLKNCEPTSMTAIRTKAHLLVRRGRSNKAKEMIEQLIPKNIKKEQLGQLRAVAALTQELAQHDPEFLGIAEKIWREYVKREPRNKMMLASFLSRQHDVKKVTEAFDICEDQVEKGISNNVKQALQIAVYSLRYHRGRIETTSPLYARVTSWFDRAQREMPDSKALMIQRSEFEDVTGNVDAMEHWLRQYLNTPNLNPVQKALVSNNLAYVLAFKGSGDEALEYIEFAVGVLGPTADLRDTRGMVYYAINDPLNALREIDASIADGGESAMKLFHKALAEYDAKNPLGAQDALDHADSLGLDIAQLSVLEKEKYDELVLALKNSGVTAVKAEEAEQL